MIYVLYHDNCMDGLAAAWAAWKKLGNDAQYIPVQYNQPLPEMSEAVTIYIVDFSYPRDILLELRKQVEILVVLDHHKTAEENLKGLDFAFFDMNKSGAILAWEYFFPDELIPELLLYVQDRDLWKWEMWKSREVSAALASYPKTIESFNQLVHPDRSLFFNLVNKGETLLEQTKQIVKTLADKAEMNLEFFFQETSQGIPILNSCTLQSELGEQLLKMYPEAPFAAVYFHTSLKERIWSLRSRGDFDVSVIAKARGGGGHKAAAGFKEML